MSRIRRDDTGVVAVLVAVLMSTILLGFGAVVVDVGSLDAERRQLQNGADAGALAVAQGCLPPATCDTSTASGGTAGQYAGLNANDTKSNVDRVCGSGATGLSACPAMQGAWDCPPLSGTLSGAPYVQVQTSTLTGGGGTLMPPLLGRALTGNSGYTGTNVKACARASWGSVQAANTSLALTISFCEWDVATNGGTSFAPKPPYPPNPATSFERVLKLHTTAGLGSCPKASHSGSDAPGAFGWLDDGAVSDCQTYVDVNNTYGDKTGNGTPSPCKDSLVTAITAPHSPVMYIPIYSGVTGTGSNGVYTLKGFAAFVVTGWYLPAASPKNQPSWLYPSNPAKCKGSDSCLYGFFTKALVPAGVIGPPNPYGTTVVQMSG